MSQSKLAISNPPVKLIFFERADGSQNLETERSPTPASRRSLRGRPAQISTPTDIRWPVVQEYLRSSSLLPNSRKLYERELKRFLSWTQCRWSELQSRHLGLYKAYLMELEVAAGKKQVAQSAGLPKIHPHRGRHTFISGLVRGKVDAYLGWL
jgi:hypothetical protein